MDKNIKNINLVSIIMPAWKAEATIANSIDSVLAQTHTNWELIVIDDGSSDGTCGVVENYIDSRIKLIKNQTQIGHRGIAPLLNMGIDIAKGVFIARLDSDDKWIDTHKLEKQVNFLINNPDYVLVGTGAVVVDRQDVEMFRYLLPTSDSEIRQKILTRNCFIHSSVMFRKNIGESTCRYTENSHFRRIEDYELWLKLGGLGKFYNIPEYSVCFFHDDTTISGRHRISQAKEAIRLIIKYGRNYPNFFWGFLLGLARLLFAFFSKILPVSNSFSSKIKKIYKEL